MAGETVVIDSLDLKNYRNYDILDMNFDKNVNIIYGDNAQGKTNTAELIGGQHNGYIYEIKIKPRVMLRLSVLHNSLIEAEM